MAKKIIGIIILVLITVSGLYFYKIKNQNIPSETMIQEEQDPRIEEFVSKNPAILNKVEIKEIKNCDEESRKYACITLKNISDSDLNYVMVVIDLIDKSGNALNDSGDTLKTFKPMTEHTFKVPASNDKADRWILSNISAE